jgi:AcrR family transcriptional regulator
MSTEASRASAAGRGVMATRGQARVDAILAAAVELVAEIGYDRVTVDAIAARAHASKATMYRRWPTKSELIAEAVHRHAEGIGPLEVADAGSLREDLLAQVARVSGTVCGGGASLLNLVEAVRDDAALRDRVREQIENAAAAVGERIAHRAVERGEAVAGIEGAAVLRVAVAQLFMQALLHGGAPDADFQRDLVDRVLLPLFGHPIDGQR